MMRESDHGPSKSRCQVLFPREWSSIESMSSRRSLILKISHHPHRSSRLVLWGLVLKHVQDYIIELSSRTCAYLWTLPKKRCLKKSTWNALRYTRNRRPLKKSKKVYWNPSNSSTFLSTWMTREWTSSGCRRRLKMNTTETMWTGKKWPNLGSLWWLHK